MFVLFNQRKFEPSQTGFLVSRLRTVDSSGPLVIANFAIAAVGHGRTVRGEAIMSIELLIFLGILFLWWYRKRVWKYPENFPPGPRLPLPMLGDAIALGLDVPPNMKKLHEKHGNLVGFMLAGHPAVSIRDFETIQKHMSSDDMSNRTPQPGFELYRRNGVVPYEENTSLVLGHGTQWNVMHRFALRYLSSEGSRINA